MIMINKSKGFLCSRTAVSVTEHSDFYLIRAKIVRYDLHNHT